MTLLFLQILHDLGVHYDETPLTELPAWRMIDSSEDIAEIQKMESKMMMKCKTPKYCCNYCTLFVKMDLGHLRCAYVDILTCLQFKIQLLLFFQSWNKGGRGSAVPALPPGFRFANEDATLCSEDLTSPQNSGI